MKIRLIFSTIFLLLLAFYGKAQTLFTYGKNTVDVKSFLHYYNSSKPVARVNKFSQKEVQKNLDLFIFSRLKIQESKELGLDTVSQFVSEVTGYRNTIAAAYLLDTAELNRLIKEAFVRSQKDVHAAYIFVKNQADTIQVNQKLSAITEGLKNGRDFLAVAQELSDEDAQGGKKGDLNFITVFSLPYEIENIIYSLRSGEVSKPVKLKPGYYIFKNLEEKEAIGKLKFQQILLAYPVDCTADEKKRIIETADTLYQKALAGANFDSLENKYSLDRYRVVLGENHPNYSVGEFDEGFEKMIRSLKKDGEISKPFETVFGMHIIKRIKEIPVEKSIESLHVQRALEYTIVQNDRYKKVQEFMIKRVEGNVDIKFLPVNQKSLFAYSDSMILRSYTLGAITETNAQTPILSIGDSIYKASHWVSFAALYRWNEQTKILIDYPIILEKYRDETIKEYYKKNIENIEDRVKYLLQDFINGSLFFEISKQKIYDVMQSVSDTELEAFFNKNKSRYSWGKSAEVIVVSSSEANNLKIAKEKLQEPNVGWQQLLSYFSGTVQADSFRCNWVQIPGLGSKIPTVGMITPFTNTEMEGIQSFAKIVSAHPKPAPKTFTEARGEVIDDFQQELEKKWIETLKKKYPIKINQVVFGKLIK